MTRDARDAPSPVLLALVLFVLSLQGITVLIILEWLPSLKAQPTGVAALGVGFLLCFGGLSLTCFRRCGCKLSLTAAFFAVTSWSAVVDFVLAAALINATPVSRFYMETGEEYFKSSWGFWALAWDGTAHYCLQLFLAHSTLLERPKASATLFWAGSIINSMPVLLLGAATGSYSAEIKPSTALNAPYVLFPIAILTQTLASSPGPATSSAVPRSIQAAAGRQPRSTAARVHRMWELGFDGTMAIFHASAILLHCWRAIVVLGGKEAAVGGWVSLVEPMLAEASHSRPSFGFVRVQLLVYFFYYVPFHTWALARTAAPPSPALTAWAMVIAGGCAQAEATCIGAAATRWVGFQPLELQPLPPPFLALHVPMALMPLAYALRCRFRSLGHGPAGAGGGGEHVAAGRAASGAAGAAAEEDAGFAEDIAVTDLLGRVSLLMQETGALQLAPEDGVRGGRRSASPARRRPKRA
jgi:hypothetical protein